LYITKQYFLKIIVIFLYFLSMASALYYYQHLDIKPCDRQVQGENLNYTCKIHSDVSKSVRLGIGVDDILTQVHLNGAIIDINGLKRQYSKQKLDDYKQGYTLQVSLKSGENILQIQGINTGGVDEVKLGVAVTYIFYFIAFILLAIPSIYLFYRLFFFVLESKFDRKNLINFLPIIIIIVGIGLRIFVLDSIPNWMYQHDYNGHVEAIKYYANNMGTLPQPDKGLQYPQQPLYYLITGALYNMGEWIHWSESERIFSIRALSVALASMMLLVAWALVRRFSKHPLTINIFLAFLALTPSFVIMGASVNNDALNSFLGLVGIYTITNYFNKPSLRHFFLATLVVLLATLTKVSSILLSIFFAAVILRHYYHYQGRYIALHVKHSAFIFATVILLVFGFILLKAYIPMSGEFRFVNSALYGNQVIPYLGISYFLSFNWLDLIEHAQATVLYNDSIRFSLPTYLYATMFLDDHIYAQKYLQGGIFKFSAQITYLLGIIYVVGLLLYLYFFRRIKPLHRFLIIPVLVNLFLIVKFLNDYWVVCNSHFRYFTPTFSAIGLIFVIGLEQLYRRYEISVKIISWVSVIFYLAQIYWLVKLIKMS